MFDHLSTGAADDLRRVTDIARSMVTRYGMAKSLGQELIVEGIEQPHQLERLRRMGVPLGQGFLLAVPMDEEDFFAVDRSTTVAGGFETLKAMRFAP